MTDNFKFDPINHEYFSGTRKLPSVTDIVGDVCGNPQYANEFHLQRGSMVHKAVALYLQGRLDEKSVDERIRGKVEAAKKAIKELSLEPPYLIEQKMFHPIYLFGGTSDVLSRNAILTDWKSSHSAATEIQEGGYVVLHEQYKNPVKRAFEVVLSEEGTYKLYEYKVARCKRLFLAAYTIYQWRRNGK
jgi:hypothetical protein